MACFGIDQRVLIMNTNQWWKNEDEDRKVIEGINGLGKMMLMSYNLQLRSLSHKT